MYEKILKWFALGLWTEEMVAKAENKGILTRDEMDKILGAVAK